MGEGSKLPKILPTWFVHAPFAKKEKKKIEAFHRSTIMKSDICMRDELKLICAE